MDEYKIEKNIPIPILRSKWSWVLDLEVGDSALLPTIGIAGIRNSVTQLGKRNDKKFSVRQVENGKYRIWRIK